MDAYRAYTDGKKAEQNEIREILRLFEKRSESEIAYLEKLTEQDNSRKIIEFKLLLTKFYPLAKRVLKYTQYVKKVIKYPENLENFKKTIKDNRQSSDPNSLDNMINGIKFEYGLLVSSNEDYFINDHWRVNLTEYIANVDPAKKEIITNSVADFNLQLAEIGLDEYQITEINIFLIFEIKHWLMSLPVNSVLSIFS